MILFLIAFPKFLIDCSGSSNIALKKSTTTPKLPVTKFQIQLVEIKMQAMICQK